MAETPTVTALSPTDLSELQSSTASIRNVCVLAHVDHGKTTLSDHLIASNGLIHPRLAGELRYMDGLEDEQVRGITMKSSSISLLHRVKVGVDGNGDGGEGEGEGAAGTGTKSEYRQYLYNLIDSPGHVDFCSEVSAAVRLSDGGFVLVDAVEGVCIQTHAVLRQAWEEGLGMCLVVNKVDRLILEMGLGCGEAYSRVMGIVQHVNMVVSSFESERWLSEADAFMEWSDTMREAREKVGGEGEEDYFSPVKGNVAFGSAYDGWYVVVVVVVVVVARSEEGRRPRSTSKSARSSRIEASWLIRAVRSFVRQGVYDSAVCRDVCRKVGVQGRAAVQGIVGGLRVLGQDQADRGDQAGGRYRVFPVQG